jgi:tetratricopeptide (TPR) repeat protein/predicted aspartyl protease
VRRGAPLLLLLTSGSAWGACQIDRYELPVTMFDLRPLITAQINGEDASFVVDSGSWYSILTTAGAARLKLRPESAPRGLGTLHGVTGSTGAEIATVRSFVLASVPLRNTRFLVGGNELGLDAVGLLGQNILRVADVEYDLANGAVRLVHPRDCRRADLAYWVPIGQGYSVLGIDSTTPRQPETRAIAFVNGQKIRVAFDTGSGNSILSRRAAERAGFRVDAPSVVPAGIVFGLGRGSVQSWIAPFESFRIGGEEVRHTRLRVADEGFLSDADVDMLLGDDFFLSHRIYVATSQNKLYFTYNGGPVFNLVAAPNSTQATNTAPPPPTHTPATNAATDATGFSRRGAALMARHEYPQAIADLTRACELAPNEAFYFYQRAAAYLQSEQPDLGKADLDHAIELKPDYVAALIVRSEVRLSAKDSAGASADLDMADHAAPPLSDVRLQIAQGYERLDLLPQAIYQYDLWIEAHREDIEVASALNARCRARALLNQDLDRALDDCDAAVRRSPGGGARADALNSRGLVYLRRGDYRRSISDYDEALKQNPQLSDSLYGRGLAELRSGMSAAGQKDLASATALQPTVSEMFTKHGVVP